MLSRPAAPDGRRVRPPSARALAANGRGSRSPRLRYTQPPGPSCFIGATVTCASTSLTSSSYHRRRPAGMIDRDRSRSSADSPSLLRRPHSAVPGSPLLPTRACPTSCSPEMNSSGMSWTAPDHPCPVTEDLPGVSTLNYSPVPATGQAIPPTSAAVWNTDHMSGLARPSPAFPLL